MSYVNYYLQARNAADQISEGSYEGPEPKADVGSFVKPRQAPQEEKDESFDDMILSYMAGSRNSVADFEIPMVAEDQDPNYSGPIGPNDSSDELTTAREALGQVESGGNYKAKGPVVKKGAYKGQYAVGKYQVMQGNISPWTKAALGKSLTEAEFLANENAQDAVVEYQLSKSHSKYGTWEDAASVWFSGRPMKKAGNASDGYNTVPQYVQKFNKARGL